MTTLKDSCQEALEQYSKDSRALADEFDVLLSTDGTATFSWNSPDIQTLAKLLGQPEFDPPRWCG